MFQPDCHLLCDEPTLRPSQYMVWTLRLNCPHGLNVSLSHAANILVRCFVVFQPFGLYSPNWSTWLNVFSQLAKHCCNATPRMDAEKGRVGSTRFERHERVVDRRNNTNLVQVSREKLRGRVEEHCTQRQILPCDLFDRVHQAHPKQ